MVKALRLLGMTMLASCSTRPAAEVTVSDLWAQPVDSTGTSAAVYMTIADRCSSPQALRSVTARFPYKASLHRSTVTNNALTMTSLSLVPVSCTGSTFLKPMGMHVMVTGLQRLRIGDSVPLTLRFNRSGELNVVAEVTTLAVLKDVDPMHMHGGSGSMKGMHMR